MKKYTLNDFNFDLPSHLIAQYPKLNRDQSKLLLFNPSSTTINHEFFYDLPKILSSDDVLVFNNTKVIKSRIVCTRKSGATVECFLIKQIGHNTWEALLKNSFRVKINESLIVNKNNRIKILDKKGKIATVLLDGEHSNLDFLDNFGETPLPPYIKTSSPSDFEKSYQTIFATTPGAVAAPTASLHFTDSVFAQLKQKKIDTIYITLHIGLGTFNPIQSQEIQEHIMHKEDYIISDASAKQLNHAIKKKKRIIAVGTTVARCLESNFKNGLFTSGQNSTSLFITPGYKFTCINGLLTNFHLPKSSLFILVSSFIGLNNALKAYSSAVDNNYRFFSFGDAMLIA